MPRSSSGFNIYSGKGVLLETLPYSVLREQAIETGKRLLSLGLKPGDRVAIVAESDGDFARIFFGCQYAGLVSAPLPLPVAFGGREGYVGTAGHDRRCGGLRRGDRLDHLLMDR